MRRNLSQVASGPSSPNHGTRDLIAMEHEGIQDVMRLKNELAIQRAIRLQKSDQGYKPSQAALN